MQILAEMQGHGWEPESFLFTVHPKAQADSGRHAASWILALTFFHFQCIRKHMQILAEKQGHGLKPECLSLTVHP